MNNQGCNRLKLAGKRFGRATVIKQAGRTKASKVLWECRCKCGKVFITVASQLKSGHTKSCGCFKNENTSRIKTTHGHAAKKTRTYTVWKNMNVRCLCPSQEAYKDYGLRGIKVCKRWRFGTKNAFANFLADMGEAKKGLTIDRINNDGSYTKSNCRWVTPSENCNNKRNNRRFTMNGKTKTITQWARERGIKPSVVRERINKLGWTPLRALSKTTYGRWV